MPFNDGSSKYADYSSKNQAVKMMKDFEQMLKENPNAKIAITYSANNQQVIDITKGYTTGDYDVSGGNQAEVFNQLIKLIKAKNLQNNIHIVPIATSQQPGGVGAMTPEEVKRDMANIAKHLGAGWTVLGLRNHHTKPDEYAIGGGFSGKIWTGKLQADCDNALKKMTDVDISKLQSGDDFYYLKEAYDQGQQNPNSLLNPTLPPPAERLAKLDPDWPPKTSPPTVTSNSSIQSIDWRTAIVPTNFEFHEIPELKESNNNYRGSITNKTNPTDPLVNVTKNSLECPLDDNGKPKQDQPEAIAAALQIAVNEHKKTHNDPLIIEANSAFDLKNLSNIMKVLKQQKIPVYFNPTT